MLSLVNQMLVRRTLGYLYVQVSGCECPVDSNAVELRDKVQRLCASENCNRVIVSLHNVFSSVKEMIQSMLHNKALRQNSYACPKTVYQYYNMVNYNATNHYTNIYSNGDNTPMIT